MAKRGRVLSADASCGVLVPVHAAELADARVDVMSTACLVAIMASGLGYHRQVESELTAVARSNHCEAHVMTSAGALVEGSAKAVRYITSAKGSPESLRDAV